MLGDSCQAEQNGLRQGIRTEDRGKKGKNWGGGEEEEENMGLLTGSL